MDHERRRRWQRCGCRLATAVGVQESILFDPATGETHFLSDLSSLLLSVVGRKPQTSQELLRRLAGRVFLDEQEALRVEAALEWLERAELVESEATKFGVG